MLYVAKLMLPGFYSMVETVKEADQYFGVKEIIRSDDKSVISVFSCCGMRFIALKKPACGSLSAQSLSRFTNSTTTPSQMSQQSL